MPFHVCDAMIDKHWPECWRYASHHACAVAEVERLRGELADLMRVGQDELIESAKDAISRSCTPEWNQVCVALADLYELYCKRVKDTDMAELFEEIDRLMAAYDEWLS